MAEAQPSLSSRLAKLAPFGKASRKDTDDEELGEQMGSGSVAGGGHAARATALTKSQLRVSSALRAFLAQRNVLPSADVASEAGSAALQALVEQPHIHVPAELTDRSHALPEYFISSSHNTYLLAHQLYGASSASAYEAVLGAGSRCVEIDAWDNADDPQEPKISHGWTLVSHISFRSVCETIREVVRAEAAQAVDAQGYKAAPIFLSLENHCDVAGQLRLVQIMREVWGDMLLSEAVRHKGHQEQEGSDDHVTLEELGSKIVVIVEYHLTSTVEESDSDSSSDEEEEQRKARQAYKARKKAAAAASKIIPELAAIGVYSQSIKPIDNSWYEEHVGPENVPHHHLINVSESGLSSHLPADSAKIARHNSKHLMRVYPKGTRISSRNLQPAPFWGIGAQICALNWQTFDASMQLNEALFSGSEGFVLKPAALRAGGSGTLTSSTRKQILRLHVAGASDVPVGPGREQDSIRPYVTVTLIHPDAGAAGQQGPPKRKTAAYRHHKLELLHKGDAANPPVTDPVWDEVLEWDAVPENELVFVRILIKSDDKFAANPKLAVAAVRLSYAVQDWRFIRMLDLGGRETTCLLLVKFEVVNVD